MRGKGRREIPCPKMTVQMTSAVIELLQLKIIIHMKTKEELCLTDTPLFRIVSLIRIPNS